MRHDAIGKVGVWIFFALSAFLLTNHLRRDLEIGESRICAISQYTINRIFRIYPLYAIVLIGHVILHDISGVDFLEHLLLLDGWGELWAISVEFQYYAVIPVIAVCSLHMTKRGVALFLVAVLMVVVFYDWMRPASVFGDEIYLFPKLVPFLFGSILSLLQNTHILPKNLLISNVIKIASILGLIAATFWYREIAKNTLSIAFSPWLSIVISGSTIGLIHAATKPNLLASVLSARPLVFLGEISFSLYLLHMFVIRLISKATEIPASARAWLALALCIVFAHISCQAIEGPSIRVGKILGERLRRIAFLNRPGF